jgi:chorismate mutase/prephenate dehydratase
MALLSQRAQVIREVADFKRQHHLPVHIPEREAAIMARLRAMNPGPLSGDTLERIYRVLIEEMRKFEFEQTCSTMGGMTPQGEQE